MTTNLQQPPRLLFPQVEAVPRGLGRHRHLAVLPPLEVEPQTLEPPAPPLAAAAAVDHLAVRHQEGLRLTRTKSLRAALVSQLLVALLVVPLVEAPPFACLD